MGGRSLGYHFAAGWLLVLVTLGLMAFYVPLAEKVLGPSYLIFFFHYPSALGCLVFFLAAGVASGVHLSTRTPESDRGARAAVEVGLLACTVTLVTGSIWAKAAWGHFWVWNDPRLMTVAVMWFTYAGYLALRASIDSPVQQARFAAVFGVIAALNIPLVWYSIKIFGPGRHPPPNVPFEPRMKDLKWFGLLAFLVLYTAFWRQRARAVRLRDEAGRIEETLVQRGQ